MQNLAIHWKSSAAWASCRMKIHDHQEVIQKYRLLSSCGSFPCNTELPNLLCLSDLSQRKGGYVQEAFMSYAWDGTHSSAYVRGVEVRSTVTFTWIKKCHLLVYTRWRRNRLGEELAMTSMNIWLKKQKGVQVEICCLMTLSTLF